MISRLGRCRWIVALSALSRCLLTMSRQSPRDEPASSLPPAPAGPTGAVGPVPRSCAGVTVTPPTTCRRSSTAIRLVRRSVSRLGPTGWKPRWSRGRATHSSGPRSRPQWVEGADRLAEGWRPLVDHGIPPFRTRCARAVPGFASTCAYTEDVFLGKKRLTASTPHPPCAPGPSTPTTGRTPSPSATNRAPPGGAGRRVQPDPRDRRQRHRRQPRPRAGRQRGSSRRGRVAPGNTKRAGSGWRILHNEVRLNHGVGLGFADAAIVSANFVHHQGQLGFGAWGSDRW